MQNSIDFNPVNIPPEVNHFIGHIATEKPTVALMTCNQLKSIGWTKEEYAGGGNRAFSAKMFYLAISDCFSKNCIILPCPAYTFNENTIFSRGQSVYSTLMYNVILPKNTLFYCLIENHVRFNTAMKLYRSTVIQYHSNFSRNVDSLLRFYVTKSNILAEHDSIYHTFKFTGKKYKYNLKLLDQINPTLSDYFNTGLT